MRKFIILFVFVIVMSFAGYIHAEGWLQRGMEIFRGNSETKQTNRIQESDIAAGLKEALKVGSENVVAHLGRENGFYLDPRAHIALPEGLQQVQNIMIRAGMGQMLNDLEMRLNRAAEMAVPKARDMFVQAISRMTLEDVYAIYNGPDDSATRYFQDRMSAPLADEFQPAVQDSLSEAGAVRLYDDVMSDYRGLPFVPDVSDNLSKHVVDKSIQAIFDYLALEEAAIRNNPAKQTTDILRRVFGQ